MICLGIDTSTPIVRVALTKDGDALQSSSGQSGKTHSETLLVAVREATDRAGVSLSSVDLIAVGCGPGAWTGLRVGITTAKALAYALSLPIVGVSTFEAVAAGLKGYCGDVVVVLDARRGEICGARFVVDGLGGAEPGGAFFVCMPDDLDRFAGRDSALVGNGVPLVPEGLRAGRRVLPAQCGEPDAAVICGLATARYRLQGPDSLPDVAPIYVRRSDAELAAEKKDRVR